MADVDVFNGDADGLCALQQLRLAQPGESLLVTGVKRDIALLERVDAGAGDRVTVLDVALDKNRAALLRLLAAGVRIRYFDHHHAGEVPKHPRLDCRIGTDPLQGTSLLVDASLGGRFRAWAVVGTFGDNFDGAALHAAAPLGLSEEQLRRLRALGTYLNYNGYGDQVEDLHFHPADLYRRLHPYSEPLDFIAADPAFGVLRDGYEDDMARARRISPVPGGPGVYIFPAAAWARRASGVYANELARRSPDHPHALLTRLPAGGFLVSVRAPLARPEGADVLCRGFATGGGRKAAAGINFLPDEDFDRFVASFHSAFPSG